MVTRTFHVDTFNFYKIRGIGGVQKLFVECQGVVCG